MQVELHVGDITEQAVGRSAGAIVNAASSALLGGGGVDGAIHDAGGPEILAACRELRAGSYPRGLPTGRAVATTAGRLPARWVIHTVGPIHTVTEDRSPLLRSCYRESLRVADELGADTVAFPLISAGIFGWPVEDAIRQALTVLVGSDAQVATSRLVLFDATRLELADQVLSELR